MPRRRQQRGQSVNAVRCALLSTFALLGCAVAQGTLRALLAFLWVLLLMTAFGLEWSARRRLREQAKTSAKPRRPRDRRSR
jgi:Flp pilus assembly protein TadB